MIHQNQDSHPHVLNSLRDLELMKDDDMYKLFSIIKMLYTINENQNFELFLQSSKFQQIKTKFYDFAQKLKDRENTNYIWLMDFLGNYSDHRPKLKSIIPILFEIISKVYNDTIDKTTMLIYMNARKIRNRLNCQFNSNLISLYTHLPISDNEDTNFQQNFGNIILNDDIDKFIDFIKILPSGINQDFTSNTLNSYVPEYKQVHDGFYLSCMFGSVKCFKYYLINGFDISSMSNEIAFAAIFGGNFEIIQIINQNYNVNFGQFFAESIKFHRYSITDWLIQNYPSVAFVQGQLLTDILDICIKNKNFEAFLFYYFNYKSQNSISFENWIINNTAPNI